MCLRHFSLQYVVQLTLIFSLGDPLMDQVSSGFILGVCFICKETYVLGAFLVSIIIREFCHWQELLQMVILMVDIGLEVLFQNGICLFCLSVGFVRWGGHVDFRFVTPPLLMPSGNSLPLGHAPYDIGPGLWYLAWHVFHFLADSIDSPCLLIHHLCHCARPQLFV